MPDLAARIFLYYGQPSWPLHHLLSFVCKDKIVWKLNEDIIYSMEAANKQKDVTNYQLRFYINWSIFCLMVIQQIKFQVSYSLL